jgi:hypothetical protein
MFNAIHIMIVRQLIGASVAAGLGAADECGTHITGICDNANYRMAFYEK